jgi:5-methylcytosine-specific restriction endonuclease McrA
VADKSKIEWTEATWPLVTVFVEQNKRGRTRAYVRQRTDRPGQSERRAQAALGLAWCRGCQEWLPTTGVRSGACRPCINAEYRATYAKDGEAIRRRVYARKRRLDPIPAWWSEDRFADFDGLCAYGCGEPASTHDHIWPVSLGGKSAPGNVVPACVSCNSSKKNRDPRPWVDRGVTAFPAQWHDVIALAVEHNTDEWVEALING